MKLFFFTVCNISDHIVSNELYDIKQNNVSSHIYSIVIYQILLYLVDCIVDTIFYCIIY